MISETSGPDQQPSVLALFSFAPLQPWMGQVVATWGQLADGGGGGGSGGGGGLPRGGGEVCASPNCRRVGSTLLPAWRTQDTGTKTNYAGVHSSWPVNWVVCALLRPPPAHVSHCVARFAEQKFATTHNDQSRTPSPSDRMLVVVSGVHNLEQSNSDKASMVGVDRQQVDSRRSACGN